MCEMSGCNARLSRGSYYITAISLLKLHKLKKGVTGSEGVGKDKEPLHCYAMQLYVNITNTILVIAFSISKTVC